MYIVIDSLQMEICVQLKQGTIISDNSPFMLFKSTLQQQFFCKRNGIKVLYIGTKYRF